MSDPAEPETTADGTGATAPASVTTFEQARLLTERGRSPAEVKQALIDGGLDEESARVVVNSLPGAPQPSVLPEPTVSLSTNALAPDLFSLGELGLSGDPVTVGQYWMAFSGVLLVVLLLVLFVPVPELFGEEGPSDSFLYFIEVVLPPVGFGVVAVAFARGAFLLTRGRRFKVTRKPK